MPFRLLVPPDVAEAMVAQARAELPNECCGMLAGVIEEGVGRVVRQIPLTNVAVSPREYNADPAELCRAHRECREAGLEFLAIYHSHPTSRPIPSRTDLERHLWDGLVSIIISLAGPEPEVQAWWLTNTDYREAEYVVA